MSVLGFGSNYIPVKRVDVKDGVFFTLCLSIGVLLVGIIQWAAFGFYKFEPFAMLGGAIWAVGNACVPFIIRSCGLGTGQLVWSVTNMGTGWATGTFGLFGKEKDTVEHFALNCLGVVMSVLSLAPFALMKDENREIKGPTNTDLEISHSNGVAARNSEAERSSSPPSVAPRPSGSVSYVSGFFLALGAGVFMGSNFDPPTYLQQIGPPKHSSNSMDYVISHFSGIVLASALYFIVYYAKHGRSSFCGREVIMPGISAGVLWGIAQIGWFKANTVLSYVIAFPIIVSVPGVLASFWGVVLFGENRGRRNLALLGAVIVLQGVGVSIIAVSKGNA